MRTPDEELDIEVDVQDLTDISDGTGDSSNPWSASIMGSLRDDERDVSVDFDITAGAPTEAEARLRGRPISDCCGGERSNEQPQEYANVQSRRIITMPKNATTKAPEAKPSSNLKASLSWQAASPTARRIYGIIAAEIAARGVAQVQITQPIFEEKHKVNKSGLAPAIRELSSARGFGFLDGTLKDRHNVFSMSDKWRDRHFETLKAARIFGIVARAPLPKPPRPVVVVGKSSKPVLDEVTQLALRDAKGRTDRRPATSRLGSNMYSEPRPITLPKLPPPWGDG